MLAGLALGVQYHVPPSIEIVPTAPIKLDFLPRDDLNVATNLKHCLCAQQPYNSPDWLSEISEFTQSGGGVQQLTEI